VIAAWSRERSAVDLMEDLQARGIEAGVVQGFDALLRDPQLAHRGHFVPLSHDPLGELLFERSGFRLSRTPGALGRAAPRLGEHTRAILGERLGLGEAEIERLIRDGIMI